MAGIKHKRIIEIVKRLRAYNPEKIYLFGSWAKGEGDSLSDVDLVVIKRTKAPFFERLKEISQHLPQSTGGLDILVYTPSEFAKMRKEGNVFVEMIVEEGRVVYER
jgi:predicted nucleotidyltransferase